MAFIYITGAPGVGKSTILEQMRNRGIVAFDLDDRRFGGPHNKASGQKVTIPAAENRSEDWFEHHEWIIDDNAIEHIKKQSIDKMIVICGVADDDKKILSMFDKIIYLSIDDNVLERRLEGRGGNDYGKNPSELKSIMMRRRNLDSSYEDMDVVTIDASGSINEVVSRVLESL